MIGKRGVSLISVTRLFALYAGIFQTKTCLQTYRREFGVKLYIARVYILVILKNHNSSHGPVAKNHLVTDYNQRYYQ